VTAWTCYHADTRATEYGLLCKNCGAKRFFSDHIYTPRLGEWQRPLWMQGKFDDALDGVARAYRAALKTRTQIIDEILGAYVGVDFPLEPTQDFGITEQL
jgi:hypothetical protein